MLHSPIKFDFPTSLITSLKARRRVHPGARASLNRDNPGKTNDPNLELSGFPDIVKKRIESDQTGKHRAGLECYLRNVSERGSRGTRSSSEEPLGQTMLSLNRVRVQRAEPGPSRLSENNAIETSDAVARVQR